MKKIFFTRESVKEAEVQLHSVKTRCETFSRLEDVHMQGRSQELARGGHSNHRQKTEH